MAISEDEAQRLSVHICDLIRHGGLSSVMDYLRGWVNDYDEGAIKVIDGDRIIRPMK